MPLSFRFFFITTLEARELAGEAKVIDGDTIYIGEAKLRIHGIDAPEAQQSCWRDGQQYSCGEEATRALESLVSDKFLRCFVSAKDRYQRWIAKCLVNDLDTGEWMVSQGYALAYRRYSLEYVTSEEHAKAQRAGLWSGSFVQPWEWRRGKRLVSKQRQPSSANTASKPECIIKGNVGSKGGRIYHTPESPWYSRTKINTAKGERWFCSETEARAAGWRAPRR